MKILIFTNVDPAAAPSNITSTTVPININFTFEDGRFGGGNDIAVPWSTLDTSTTMNAAIKAWVISEMSIQLGYTYNILNDQLFFICGFVGL